MNWSKGTEVYQVVLLYPVTKMNSLKTNFYKVLKQFIYLVTELN